MAAIISNKPKAAAVTPVNVAPELHFASKAVAETMAANPTENAAITFGSISLTYRKATTRPAITSPMVNTVATKPPILGETTLPIALIVRPIVKHIAYRARIPLINDLVFILASCLTMMANTPIAKLSPINPFNFTFREPNFPIVFIRPLRIKTMPYKAISPLPKVFHL